MDTPPRRRFLIILIGVGAIAAVVIGVGIYGLIRGPGQNNRGPAPTGTSETGPTLTSATPSGLPTIIPAADAVDYATGVAEAIFTWDTASAHTRADYVTVPAAEAAPTGEEGNGLVADLDNYYPTAEQWRTLLEYETRQYLTVTDASIPPSWPGIVESSGDQLAEGTVAVTIRGERHRAGVWAGEDTQSVHEVAFTVFVACAPDADRCYLLRLSGLGTPLE